MAQMNRNVNLEEIDADALFGIDALKNQTFLQKVIFFGSVIAGVLINVCLPLFFETPKAVCIALFLVLLLIGVAFGCNYTEDMTYGKYLYFFFFKPSRHLTYASTEDIACVKKKAEEIKKQEEAALLKQKQANPEAQKKLLIKMVVFIIVIAVSVGGIFAYAAVKKGQNLHHVVTEEEQ